MTDPASRLSPSPLRITLVYVAVAGLWIVFSDQAFEWLFGVPAQVTLANMLKGGTFVIVSALSLYVLLRSRIANPVGEDPLNRRPGILPTLALLATVITALTVGVILITLEHRQDIDLASSIVWIALTGVLTLFATASTLLLSRQRQQTVIAQKIALSQSERLRALHLLAAIADSSSDAIFAVDVDGRFILFNRASQRLTGQTQEQVLGRDETALFPPDIARQQLADNRKVMDNNITLTLEEEIPTINGRRRFLTTKGPLHDNEGHVIGLYGIARDITERRRMETALAATADFVARAGGENFFRDTVRHAAESLSLDYVHIALLTPAGNRVETLAVWLDGKSTDNRAYDLTGTPCEHVLDLGRLCIESDAQALYPKYAELARIGAQSYVGEPLVNSAGQAIGLMVGNTRAPLANSDMVQSTLRILAARAAVEWEQREITRRLGESEERLRLALQAANQGTYDLNVQTGEAIVSPEYASMLGYDAAEFHETNAAWIERLHPGDKERVARAYRDYIAGRLPVYRVEFRQRTRSGDWKWILSMGRLVERDAAGQPLRMLGTHTDINDRKRMEEDLLRQADELRRRNDELERFNRATVGRELDMIRLKQRVNELAARLGEAQPYGLDFLVEADQGADLPVSKET
jgi:PAS domain S-box-containing protein